MRILNRRVAGLFAVVAFALLQASAAATAATMAEKAAFNSAEQAFRIAVWERAESLLAEFATNFPSSSRLAEARLLQAQARFKQGNYAGAIELLSSAQATAGKWGDEYVYWIGEAGFEKGDFAAAADAFARLAKDFPQSPLRLEAIVAEAAARGRLQQWDAVIELLKNTNGVFQATVKTNPGLELIPRGFLLLGEAQAAKKDYRGAEATLEPWSKRLISPKLAWQWQYLMCRIQLADGRLEQALQSTSNLLTAASNTAQPALLAESVAFKAGLLETMGRGDQAIESYKENLVATAPAERQRQALLKTTDLYLAQKKTAEAAATLDKFLGQHPNAPSADLALLTLGELRLRQHLAVISGHGTNIEVTVTNPLPLAHAAFERLTTNFPSSPLIGKGQLNLGWCLWLERKMPAAETAFRAATERLPASLDQATAFFKLGDSQFQQQNFTGALGNYKAILEKFQNLPEVKTNLLESGLYQIVRAGLAAGDLTAATNGLHTLLAVFPNGFRAERALLLTGQEITRQGSPKEARDLFLDFVKKAPNADLLPELQLAIARTYEQENKWAEAIGQSDQWVLSYTNNPGRPRAEYYRAWAHFQAGNETNALSQFTNFVAQFPLSELTPRAQWWVADYYFRAGNFKDAEISYKSLFQNTNWSKGDLGCQAMMMAGRVAVARQSWSEGIGYFLALSTNAPCSDDLRVQALFAYGDILMSAPDPGETNKLANYREAILVFQNISERFPTNRQTVLVWGEMANCYLQWALHSRQLASDTNVLYGFQQVINSPLADAKARSIATVGLAILHEKQAPQKAGAAQNESLEKAFNLYLDVFHGKILRENEQPDLFWVRKAGMEAGRLAETLQRWASAKEIYQQLRELLPVYRARLDKNIQRVQEHLPP